MTEEEKITYEEYEKARHIVEKFNYQQKATIQVSVRYNADIFVTLQIPNNWDYQKIKDELEGGPSYRFEKDDEPSISYGEILIMMTSCFKNNNKND